jgi:DNA-binding MarR family transcriptional regulator
VHLLDARARLLLMGLLHQRRDVSARAARQALGLTDGNLASHAARLEEAGWLRSRRALSPSGFELRYSITPAGAAAFLEHVAHLRRLLDGWGAEGTSVPDAAAGQRDP